MAGIRISGLSKVYDGQGADMAAVSNLNLEIGDNRFVTLLGPSGCGKTTTLRLIAGYLKPDAGSIHVGDRLLSSKDGVVPPEKRGMGMVFQNYAVWPHKTVFENVVFGLRLRKVPSAEARERVTDLPLRLGGRRLPDLQAEHDVLVHGLVRPHRVVLEHHAHAALIRRHHAAGRRQKAAVDVDGAGVRHDIAGDQAQRRGLAAARRAEQRDKGIVLDLKVDVVDGRDFRVHAKTLRQSPNRDPGHSSVLARC